MLRAEGIHKVYRNGKKDLHVLQGIALEVKKGEQLAIVGPSGAGKSTLLHILGGIDRPSQGKIFLDNLELYALPDNKLSSIRNERIGFVFQFYHLLPEFTALENALLPALVKREEPVSLRKQVPPQASEIVDLMRELGLGDRMHHRPSELSGGEQQRVAIARALVNNPEILLCDEPTGNLDSKKGEEILELIFGLNKKDNTTIVLVTHNIEIAKKAGRVMEMRDGMIVNSL